METARKAPGRPFQKGDPRINRGGRPKALLTKAVSETLTDDDATAIIRQVISQAKDGDLQAVAMLWDRLEGKAIGRNESGQPGDFTGLEDIPTADLLKLVRRQA